MKYEIFKELCDKCGECEPICPLMAIKIDVNGDYYIDRQICNQCGLCPNVCDEHAILEIEE